MSGVYALYADGDAAQRAVNALRSAGVDERDIEIMSSEPMEHFVFGEMNRATRIWYLASGGGFLGMLFGTWLPTGNMPIVSWWPNMIVIFELTMLGAILATVATLVVTGGLLRRRPALYDPAVNDGKILVGVENPSGNLAAIEQALGTGAVVVKRR